MWARVEACNADGLRGRVYKGQERASAKHVEPQRLMRSLRLAQAPLRRAQALRYAKRTKCTETSAMKKLEVTQARQEFSETLNEVDTLLRTIARRRGTR